MKKLFYLFALAAVIMGCSKEETIPTLEKYTLTGYSAVQTKTDFGTPVTNGGQTTIPFAWSAGDKIWSNGAQSGAAEIDESTGKAVFSFANTPGTAVYYNMTGSSNQANVPAAQSIANNLGANGDFGYAEVSNGTFTLNHATAYLWFDVAALPSEATLESITVDAGNAAIAGKANWNGEKFTNKTETSGKITLSVNKTSVSADAADIAMVVLPVKVESATVTYALTVGGLRKYYEQNLQECTLAAGNTYSISVDLSAVSLYELRVLTFEDEPGNNYWNDLIPAEDKQAYGVSPLLYPSYFGSDYIYSWYDNNTQLAHEFPYNWNCYDFAGGGYAISTHTGTVEDMVQAGEYNIYNYQLSIPLHTGHKGSENFCLGYHDSQLDKADDIKPALYFQDNTPRTIDHMYITNASITMYCMLYGNSFSDAFDADDFLRIVATGYVNGVKGNTVSYTLAEGADMKVDEWVKWDLTGLGKVDKVVFHMEEFQVDDYGYAKYTRTPMYFAFDDVAVRFEE